MAYDVTLAQINAGINGFSQSNTALGFPVSTNFHTLLMSYWMCGPPGTIGWPAIWPEFNTAQFFTFDDNSNYISLTNVALAPTPFYTGTWTLPTPGTRMHFLLSVDTHAQTVQLYVNDLPVTVTGTWTGTPPFNFNVRNNINAWQWDVADVVTSGKQPALGDVWISNPTSFVDLTVTSNRRKFINQDLTPIDLGLAGTVPFGTQPAMYMTVRPGGVATDILINRGLGGGTWIAAVAPPTLQTVGLCALPTPPPPPPETSSLAMDNLLAFAPAQATGDLVWLDWSDDRGHSFGSPVSQPLGAAGAYLTSVQWQRLAYARDRVFRLTWSAPIATALQGAFIEVDSSAKS